MGDLLFCLPILVAIAGLILEIRSVRATSSRHFLTWLTIPSLVPAAMAFGAALLIKVFPNMFGALYYPEFCIRWPHGGEYRCSQDEWLASERYDWAVIINIIAGIILLIGYPLFRFIAKKLCRKSAKAKS